MISITTFDDRSRADSCYTAVALNRLPAPILRMALASPVARAAVRSVPLVIVAGCAIAAITFGPRSTMGFFLTPMSNEHGWGREIFALAIAIQNLVWGMAQPFAGMLADRYGTGARADRRRPPLRARPVPDGADQRPGDAASSPPAC